MTADQDDSVVFGVLGPLSVQIGGAPVPLQSAKTRVVLASLLLRPNRTVSVEELVDRLWDTNPPSGARNAAQSYVMRLRKALGDAGGLISTQPAGYLIEAAPDMVDLGRFRARIAAADTARARSDATGEARELRAALAIWRGAPLSDVPSELLHVQETQRLAEERLQALERLMDIELALGHHTEVIGELYALTEENRLRERFWGQLMLALFRADRQADALSAYRKVAALLREELGIDPGDGLRELHQRILVANRTPGPQQRPRPPAPAPERRPVPFQLPAGIPDFVGRDGLIEQIRALTLSGARHAVPVVVLSGPPGAGKTALAVHAAHRLREQFPDGQLYVNLRGFSASPPLAATDALGRFLRALGVAPDHIPHEVDEQSTLLRSLLNGRKVFIVLDNAASPEHVRPLLPSDTSCAVLVTSRNNLPGLTALNGARRLAIDMVSPDEARDLVANIIGAERVEQEPDATDELAATCGFLPLSLRIAATNLAGSGLGIAEYTQQLRSGNRLDAMEIEGDDQAAVRLAFDLSYSTLKPTLSRFFRMLSLAPGPDIEPFAAAAVTDTDPATARRLLDQLTSANLLAGSQGRFAFHDLIKEFAEERVTEQEPLERRRAALLRLLGFYLRWAYAASDLAYPDTHRADLPDLPETELEPGWTQPAEALAWTEREIENLGAMICVQPAENLPVWALADALLAHLQRRRQDVSWESVLTSALTAARRFGDARAQGIVHRGLGRLHFHHGHYPEAVEHFGQAVRQLREAGDVLGEARSRIGLGSIAMDTGRFTEALDHTAQALALAESAEDKAGQSTILYDLALTQVHFGLVEAATANLDRCRALAAELNLFHLTTRCHGATGLRDKWAGDFAAALDSFGAALTGWTELRFTVGWIETVRNIADTALLVGHPDIARTLGQRALSVAEDVGQRWGVIGCRVVLGNAAVAEGDLDTAAHHLTQARALAGAGPSYWNWAIIRGTAAAQRAADHLVEAVAVARTGLDAQFPRELAAVRTELAAALLARGDHPGATEYAAQARESAQHHGHRVELTAALLVLAEAAQAAGDPAGAAEARHAAEAAAPRRTGLEPVLRRLVEQVGD